MVLLLGSAWPFSPGQKARFVSRLDDLICSLLTKGCREFHSCVHGAYAPDGERLRLSLIGQNPIHTYGIKDAFHTFRYHFYHIDSIVARIL